MTMRRKRIILITSVVAMIFIVLLSFQLSNITLITYDPVVFTDEELNWMSEHPVITYAPDSAFHPYEFLVDDKFQGLSIDYVKWIEDHSPLSIDTININSWGLILDALENQDIDLISSTAKTPQREAYALFTTSYIGIDNVAFIRTDFDDNFYEHDLINMKTAVVHEYYSQDILELRHPDIQLILVQNAEEGIQRLSSGEIDVFITGSGQALYAINSLGINNIKINEKVRISNNIPLSLATHQGNPELQSILNKILSSMPESVKIDILNKWTKIDFAQPITNEVFMNLLYVFLGIGIFILLIYIWNQSLKQQVELKTNEIQLELKNREFLEIQLKNMINAIPSPIYVKNSKGMYLHVNKAFCDLIPISSPEDIEFKEPTSIDFMNDEQDKFLGHLEHEVFNTDSPQFVHNHVLHQSSDIVRTFYSTKIPFQLLGNDPVGVLGIDVDITNRIQAKTRLKQMNTLLEAKVEDRSRALNNINDELSTAMVELKKNEASLNTANDELTELLQKLQYTQKELIEKESIAAQGQNLSQVTSEMTIPLASALELSDELKLRNKDLLDQVALRRVSLHTAQKHCSDLKVSLHEIVDRLQESSKIVDTFKLISLIDHGLQPTRIHLKLMLETCFKQVVGVPQHNVIDCPEHLMLKASPNAFHKILSYLIQVTMEGSSTTDSTSQSKKSTIKCYLENDQLQLEFIRPNTKSNNVPDAADAADAQKLNLGLHIIQSIIQHYFDGHLDQITTHENIILKLVIPSLFVLENNPPESN